MRLCSSDLLRFRGGQAGPRWAGRNQRTVVAVDRIDGSAGALVDRDVGIVNRQAFETLAEERSRRGEAVLDFHSIEIGQV